MKNVLITGASGFLGIHLIEALQNTEFTVYALTSKKENLINKYKNCIVFSIEDWENDLFPMDEIDVVVHCAFARAHKEGKDIADSILFSNRLFTKFIKRGVPAIINISTQEVYGKTPTPWIENIVNPNTTYGVVKLFSEMSLIDLSRNTNTITTNIRLAGLLGPATEDRMVNKFVAKVFNNEPIKILNGKLVFSQLEITDAVNGIISLLHVPFTKWKTVYNLGYKKSYSIIEIANIVKNVGAAYNKNSHIISEKSDIVIEAELDSSTFYRDTNWTPKLDMKAIVLNIFKNKFNNE